MASRLFLIINAASGPPGQPSAADDLVKIFSAGGFDVDLTIARCGADIGAAAKRAIAEKASVVVAGGGDGTVSAVAQFIVQSEICLGVIPLGTLNHFAKDIGVPLGPHDAAKQIVTGRPVAVDVGEVNGRVFVNNASIGLYPRIVRKRTEQQNRFGWSKWTALVYATLASLHVYRLLKLRIRVASEEMECRVPFVFIGNNAYNIEGFHIGGRERLDGGVLGLYFARHCGRARLFFLAIRALFGRLHPAKDFDMRLIPDVVIEPRHARIDVALDGEIHQLEAPLRFRARPKSLVVMAPPASEGRG